MEDTAVLDLKRTPADLSRDLGRSVASISSRRARLLRPKRLPGRDASGAMRLPKGRTHWLLAKTCPRCSRLLAAVEFTIKSDGGRNTFCLQCNSERVLDRREQDADYRHEFDARVAERQREVQSSALESAHNHRKQWTGPELELVMRTDLTDKQKAEALGRSFYAVRHIIRKMRNDDPRKVHLAGLPQ